jgi:hypothetical protein
MRVMIIVKGGKACEAGVVPDEQSLAEMGRYNEELTRAGVLLALEGLQPSSKGARVSFSGTQRKVTDGPFTESKELIGGYWLWQVESLQAAIEWLKRAPFKDGTEVEIRPLYEADDFSAKFTQALRRQEASQRAPAGRLRQEA